MRWAWDRIDRFPTQALDTRFGRVEYADGGDGSPLLVAHGVLGGHVDSIGTWWAELTGDEFRTIAPSRFGYFGSALPPNASPADQADVYAALLDHLRVENAAAIGFSAGSGSVLEFARRHRDRTSALVLACCRLGGGVTLPGWIAPLFRLAYSADPVFWAFKKAMPMAYLRMMGAPKGFRPRGDEEETLAGVRDLLFPFRPRRDGAVFDGFVSNLVADRFPLEELEVPTLVINARDDPLAPYVFAERAASRIPGAALHSVESGGHLFLRHAEEVRSTISAFIAHQTPGDTLVESEQVTHDDATPPQPS
jgi:pimeloyl-ACP methyl ester carboxylesterase